MNLRRRIALSMLSVVAISGGISAVIGGGLLWRQLSNEAENRVRQDLNAAREFYRQRLASMETALLYTALGERFAQAVARADTPYLANRLAAVRGNARVDFLYVTDAEGRVLQRAHGSAPPGDSVRDDRLVAAVLAGAEAISGTILVPAAVLEREDKSLADRARISILPTPKAAPASAGELDSGMMLCCAAAVRGEQGRLIGVLRAGTLLNRNYALVDQVQNTVFRDERYKGRLLGTATIFQGDVRISTNVLTEEGARAVGTRVSAEVKERVLAGGETWLGTAWVVNDLYISAYEPIRDPDGGAIGMLYVGVLARKFSALTLRTLSVFALVTLAGLVAAGIVAWKLAGGISRPVSSLAAASASIAKGEFTQALPVGSADEIGSLTASFNTMARSLRERDEQLKEQTRRQLGRSEHLAAVGRLAAGVAHEVNNPLTGVLTFAHILLKKAPEGSQDREDIETIIGATTRCRDIVRGLLDFSRQSEPRKKMSDLNAVLRQALNLTQNQALIGRVEVIEQFDGDLPPVLIDDRQIQDVAVNIIVNALDAMPDGGRFTVRTKYVPDAGGDRVEFEMSDTGCGISPETLGRVFDPFFTTKPTGKGTGLGLAVAYGLVTEHGGSIGIASELGRGTTVTVRLPAMSGGDDRE